MVNELGARLPTNITLRSAEQAAKMAVDDPARKSLPDPSQSDSAVIVQISSEARALAAERLPFFAPQGAQAGLTNTGQGSSEQGTLLGASNVSDGERLRLEERQKHSTNAREAVENGPANGIELRKKAHELRAASHEQTEQISTSEQRKKDRYGRFGVENGVEDRAKFEDRKKSSSGIAEDISKDPQTVESPFIQPSQSPPTPFQQSPELQAVKSEPPVIPPTSSSSESGANEQGLLGEEEQTDLGSNLPKGHQLPKTEEQASSTSAQEADLDPRISTASDS